MLAALAPLTERTKSQCNLISCFSGALVDSRRRCPRCLWLVFDMWEKPVLVLPVQSLRHSERFLYLASGSVCSGC